MVARSRVGMQDQDVNNAQRGRGSPKNVCGPNNKSGDRSYRRDNLNQIQGQII